MTAPAATSAPTAVGERYRSLFIIGRGGMGAVEVALERVGAQFERIVALKRMLPEAARDVRHLEMFLREARLAALLSHPNVVHAFDFGEAKGELFLAMEYVEGEQLSQVVRTAFDKEARFAPALVAHVLAEICDGLHAAHELRDMSGAPLNVVHRDVSPHNVMIAYEGHVKLLDFGVAKIEDDRGVTKTGEVKGKTAYMSPEQAMGDKLDRRSDLYSIGAVLFECVAGRRMWGEGTDMEVIRRLALEEPPRLADAAPETPTRLCELHRRLVAKDREDRPRTARAVADELRAFIAETGTRPDARVMRAVMTRLFADEEARRKQQLNDALGGVVSPGRAKSLRATLGSGAGLRAPDPPPAAPTADATASTVDARDARDVRDAPRPAKSGKGNTLPLPLDTRAPRAAPAPARAPHDPMRDSTSALTAPTPRRARSRVVAVAMAAVSLLGGAAIAVLAALRAGGESAPNASPAAPSAPPAASIAPAPSAAAGLTPQAGAPGLTPQAGAPGLTPQAGAPGLTPLAGPAGDNAASVVPTAQPARAPHAATVKPRARGATPAPPPGTPLATPTAKPADAPTPPPPSPPPPAKPLDVDPNAVP